MERIQNGTQDNVNARQDKTKSLRLPGQTAREREMAAMVQEYNATSRVKSLMEMHGEKSQKAVAELQETKMKGGKGFDRDRDMNLRQVDDKKFRELTSAPGKGLTSMFGSGESRFL
ncbi:hypothetical protein SARC_10234 [Sphaeroforma arctica JP610]|uniref:DUF3752 domain-containing protein n=1 Tax=Sphaeroforma arctica JP610 TaxID=667725 RepID=A0A0L0FKK9_9EUKA|nr:hypothetical protein SARC_10234 [Sphaeroforma arctica JP610]KNC77300.1 hypothetical protein SARC_10234 [Sphaeroforma arctica JP610]|eukprot:XP_014151202.1 hypothetical protein SARC_10234 [Sphaeroforma arctica JP610]